MSLGSLNSRALNTQSIDFGSDVVYPIDFPIDSVCLGEFNAAPINSYELNACRFFASLGTQQAISFAQLVGVLIEGTVITIAQQQKLNITISGLVISFGQSVKKTIPAGEIIRFTQVQSNVLSVYGWDAFVNINGFELDKSVLSGDITITKASNQNTLCEFKVRTTNPLDFISSIDGGAVVINYFDNDGGHRLFTGTVDLPEIDIINKWIIIKCSDRREELIKQKMLTLLPSIGRYSKQVQGEITSVGQEMEYRLQTVPSDVDFDASNVPNINSWYTKATADYVFTNSDVYYRQPSISWQSRGSVVNDITIEVKYQYPRLYHYQRPFNWTTTAPEAGLVSGGHQDDYSFPTVGMLRSAADSAGWKINATLEYTESLSNYWITYTNVVDTGGNVVRTPVINHLESEDNFEVTYAQWEGSTRFAQTVEEVYTLTVNSTQSINQYGSLTAFSNYEVKADYSTNSWENYKLVSDTPSDAVVSNLSYYVDKDINKSEKNEAVLTAIDKAKVQIIASHRDTTVTLQTPLKPSLELKHTVEIDTTPLSCKGKVVSIKHVINLIERKGHTTEINLALFRSQGSAVTTDSIVPTKPIGVINIPSATVVLGNHLGYDFDSLPVITTQIWNGFVGNTLPPLAYTRYQEKFIVDTPSAPADLRDLKTLPATATYEVALPNDDLDIVF